MSTSITRRRFKNVYELVNLRAKFSILYEKIVSVNVWVRYFVWNFKGSLWNSTQNIWPIHWKMCSLLTTEDLRVPRFTNSCFWNAARTPFYRMIITFSLAVRHHPGGGAHRQSGESLRQWCALQDSLYVLWTPSQCPHPHQLAFWWGSATAVLPA